MIEKTCCFFGHRKIEKDVRIQEKLYEMIEWLITKAEVDTFLFGSKSEFDALCLKTVTEIKKKYPHIKRIYVRAEFPYINSDYRDYLLESYDDTYYPENIISAGKAVYVERNKEMIDKCFFCLVYYNEQYTPTEKKSVKNELPAKRSKSGTKIAYDYAKSQNKVVFNVAKKPIIINGEL